MKWPLRGVCLLFAGALTISVPALAETYTKGYLNRPDVNAFIKELVEEEQFTRKELEAILGQAKKSDRALALINRPAEGTMEWKDYRKIFMTPERVQKGVKFWQGNADILANVEKEYGIPAQVIIAIIGVETYYGRQTGGFKVLDTLTTLGFDFPRRSKFFQKELKNLLILAREQKLDATELTGSYAGAMGIPQFMPSSYRAYAVDYTADQQANIWNTEADAIASVANYLSRHGWKKDQLVAEQARVTGAQYEAALSDGLKPDKRLNQVVKSGWKPVNEIPGSSKVLAMKLQGQDGPEYWLGMNNFYVITRYNRSRMYALAVHQLAKAVMSDYKKTIPEEKQTPPVTQKI
ncbi:lytic murein transglycosylase B [Endozoicomonas sp. (ex Bugula neritina AB1)]|nr:lytic murein transglycosylase B [Endozoicomonas sp. (ex Bugula neritina AB1)]